MSAAARGVVEIELKADRFTGPGPLGPSQVTKI